MATKRTADELDYLGADTNDIETLLQGEQLSPVLASEDVSELTSQNAETADGNIMVKIKAVVKLMIGWEVGPLIRSNFTRSQSMELRGPSGTVYRVDEPLDFAAALMNEEDMRQLDNSQEARDSQLTASFRAATGRLPNIDELLELRKESAYIERF